MFSHKHPLPCPSPASGRGGSEAEEEGNEQFKQYISTDMQHVVVFNILLKCEYGNKNNTSR
jgi:hypothetical protein